jgi:hypothetical protein
MFVVNGAEVADRCVRTFTLVVTAYSKCHVLDQLLWAVQSHGILMDLQFEFEVGEETLHHGVVLAGALG